MTNFDEWCNDADKTINNHHLTLLTTTDDEAAEGIDKVAAVVPTHYASPARIAAILERLGKPAASKYLANKLPTDKKARSGDVGEILASSYIEQNTVWDQSVKKLRWKDSRNMALRGDDMLAVGISEKDELLLLKGESKSRAKLSDGPIKDARKSLDSNDGLPNPHSLSFLADRLAEDGRVAISDRIESAMLSRGIRGEDVTHMIFTFSGNDPESYLTKDLQAYQGAIGQWSIGLRVQAHQAFIKGVFEKVSVDGVG